MDLIFGIAALTALILAFRLRKSVRIIEDRLRQLESSIDVVADGVEALRLRAQGGQAGAAPLVEGAPEASVPQPPLAAESLPPPAGPAAGEPASEPPPEGSESAPGIPAVPALPAPSVAASGPAKPWSLEEALGTRWAVWVGGAAVMLGAVLLVRHSIEQGWFGPGTRIAMGALLALALVAAGEWLRRRDPIELVEAIPVAHIPSMLTAAGTLAAFGTAYAAYAVYDFIGPAVAFVLLGAIAVATMLLAALHGPALAGLGLVASLAVPLLVSSDRPAPYPLVVYLLVVSAAAQVLARMRRWLWLATTAVVGVLLWTTVFLLQHWATPDAGWLMATYVHVVLQGAIAAAVLAIEPHLGIGDEEAVLDRVASGALFAVAAATIQTLEGGDVGIAAFALFALAASALLVTTGVISLPAVVGAPVAGLVAVAALYLWPIDWGPPPAPGAIAPVREPVWYSRWPLPLPEDRNSFLLFGAVATIAIAGLSGLRLMRAAQAAMAVAGCLATAATVPPLLGLSIAYLRAVRFESSWGFALAAAALALGFAIATERFLARERTAPTPAIRLGTGALASAAIAGLALALIAVLDRGFLTVAIALTALGTAFVAARLDIPALRFVVAVIGVAVLGRLAWDPLIMSGGPGDGLIVNWLLVGYGVPALAFWGAARLLRPGGDDGALRVSEALAVLFTALLGLLEIRHGFHGSKMLTADPTHAEVGLMMVTGLAFSAALSRIGGLNQSAVLRAASLVLACLTAAGGFVTLAIFANPLLVAHPVRGPAIASSLAIGYAAPALAALVMKEVSVGRRPVWFVRAMGFLALALAFAYVTLEVRHLFQGASIRIWRATGDPEMWAYSAAWLALGVAFLAWGVARGSKEARLASLVVVVIAVLKVFLVDLADLRGIWRPLSLIGLGLVLLGIALVYQRLIFAHPRPQAQPVAEPGP